jgi:elongation factor Ts
MAISAAMVKNLREKTGLPMMECKAALQEAGGDEAQAIELLRKKAGRQMEKRAGRATGQGRVVFYRDAESGRAALVEMLCETEPVAGTEDFIKLAEAAAVAATKLDDPTPEAILAAPVPENPSQKIEDVLHDVVNRIRENIKIGRVGVAGGHCGAYVHHDARKGVLVEFSGECPQELASDVCMHIVAMRPPYTRREDVPAEDVARETEAAKAEMAGKPANIIDKIVSGKIDKWLSEIVLLEQPFVKDDKRSVGDVLKGHAPDLTISRICRVEIGEG